MKVTITPEQRKKISKVASLMGRLGGGKTSEAQTAARQKNIRKAIQTRLEKRKQLAA